MDASVQNEVERLKEQSSWLVRFSVDGQGYGKGRENEPADVRPASFFRHLPQARRILELGACQGGGTFQLAAHAGVQEVVAIEGRDYHVEKAQFIQKMLGVTNVKFLCADLETFDLTTLGRFDAVYCVGFLYHLPRPWELLARLAAVSDHVYINTHYVRLAEADLTLHGYKGMRYQEYGYADPLSGLSPWSFWPTLPALTQMLIDAGFLPEILEIDSVGPGQSPHGTTLLARRLSMLPEEERRSRQQQLQQALKRLPRSAGSPNEAAHAWWRRVLNGMKRSVRRIVTSSALSRRTRS